MTVLWGIQKLENMYSDCLLNAALQPILTGFPSVGGVDWLRETTGHFEVSV